MAEAFTNLLYRRPELYEALYPEPDESTVRFCLEVCRRHLGNAPRSDLDIGCGTGRDMRHLVRTCPDPRECSGIDLVPAMIDYARRQAPRIDWRVADMRDVRLGRSFDALLCLGSAFAYALTDEDVERTLGTFAAHARPGSVLAMDLLNAAGFLPGGCFEEVRQFHIRGQGVEATGVARHWFDRPRQRMVRAREWELSTGERSQDRCEYRLHLPLDFSDRLRRAGFQTVELADNKALTPSDLTGPHLYIGAVFTA